MQCWLLFFLALGLAADAATVSMVNGICHPRRPVQLGLVCGLAFGFFQGLMPLIGYFVGISFFSVSSGIDHWVAFLLLAAIGMRMALESLKEEKGPQPPRRLSMRILLLQAFATSVDALAVGIGLGVIAVNIAQAVFLIGAVTFVCCFVGVQLGRLVGNRFSQKAQLLGGVLLVLIGLHILVDHLEAVCF